jgi:hypothetical protein
MSARALTRSTASLGEKGVDDLAKAAVKNADRLAAKNATEAAAKNAAEAAAKNATEAAVKNATEAAAKNAAEAAAKKSSTLVKTGKYAAGAAVVAGGIYYIADPIIEKNKKNGARLNITSITKGSSEDTAIITYTEPIDIYIKDTVTLSGTNSETVVNGEYVLAKVISSTKLAIKLKDGERISKNGTTGLMILNTTVANQRSLLNADILDAPGDLLNNIKDFIFDLPGFKYIKYFFYFIIAVIALKIFFMIYGMFNRNGFGKKFNFGKKFKKR